MKRRLLMSAMVGMLAVSSANAGILRAVTKPIFHPKQTLTAKVSAAHVVNVLVVKPVLHVAKDVFNLVF